MGRSNLYWISLGVPRSVLWSSPIIRRRSGICLRLLRFRRGMSRALVRKRFYFCVTLALPRTIFRYSRNLLLFHVSLPCRGVYDLRQSLFRSVLLLLSILGRFRVRSSFPCVRVQFLVLLDLFLGFLSPSLSSFSVFRALLWMWRGRAPSEDLSLLNDLGLGIVSCLWGARCSSSGCFCVLLWSGAICP